MPVDPRLAVRFAQFVQGEVEEVVTSSTSHSVAQEYPRSFHADAMRSQKTGALSCPSYTEVPLTSAWPNRFRIVSLSLIAS